MLEKRDNLHYNFRKIDGYNKAFNFVISEREAGKTTAVWLDKAYKSFKEEGRPSIVIRRLINDITETYINDIQAVINKFENESLRFDYKKGGIKEGVVDVKVNGKIFLRVIAMSNPISRIKSLLLRNIKYIIFDEFICNMKLGEKYLPNEAFKFKELYNTFQRETTRLKCYFLGNPYSLYNPYFIDFGINSLDLIDERGRMKRGKIFASNEACVEMYEIKEELRQQILLKNPLYSFDDSYTKYAREGVNINDLNIPIAEMPRGYQLAFVFKLGEKKIAVYQDMSYTKKFQYYCAFIEETGARRILYCFDFQDIVERTILLNNSDKLRFKCFKNALRTRRVNYASFEVYYLIEEVYIHL